jgi:hypothetical protein
LGVKACMAKYRVGFVTVQKLLEELLLSAKDGSLLDKLLGYSRKFYPFLHHYKLVTVALRWVNFICTWWINSIDYQQLASIVCTGNCCCYI